MQTGSVKSIPTHLARCGGATPKSKFNYKEIMKHIKTLILTSISILSFVFSSHASVSFDIPENHPDFPYLDSLYTQITKQHTIVKRGEKKFLTDPLVLRQKKFEAKEEYFDYCITLKQVKTKVLLAFYKQLQQYYETRMAYFEKLLSILKGDDRPPCFALYRQARDNNGAVQRAILKYTPQEIILGED